MIYLKVRGRAGNQFFQFATVKNFQTKYCKNEEIALDFSDLKKLGTEENGFKDSLQDFEAAKYYKTVDKIKANILQKVLIFIMKVPNAFFRLIGLKDRADILSYKFEKKVQPFINRFGVYYMIHGYSDFKPCKSKNKIFYGNFESAKYFEENEKIIKEMFTPKESIIKKNKELYDIIEKSNSICITIRRGDFVDNPEFKKVHYICDSKYFYKAVEIIKEKVEYPVFIVFSDDIEWVKDNMEFGVPAFYEDGTDPIWEKIRLMYSCKHFVISNSTFSWWAQYLSRNKNKVVIAPKRWKNSAYKKDTSKLDIYQDFWMKI